MSDMKRRSGGPQRLAIAIMAAGKGTRLKSKHPKILHEVGGKPLITPETITKLRDFHSSKKAAMTILTSVLPDPTGYGRVIRKSTKSDDVQAIVEQKSATSKQQKVREINSGFYAFAVKPLFSYIDKLSTNNPHGEFYLTDMAAILGKAKQRVVAVETNDAYEILGGNTRAEL